ncbi:MAG: hypothetical protein ABIP68_05955 [Ferruginibacter sp.]
MIQINFIKKVEILSSIFKIKWDKKTDGGSFNWSTGEIVIGVKSYYQDSLYTFSILSHEIMETVLSGMGARFYNGREDNWLFSFNHQVFETAIQIHSQVISKFIK